MEETKLLIGDIGVLSLYLLGYPRCIIDGHIVTIRRRKVLALLSYLGTTVTPHSRDALAELLYPNLDRDHAFSDLRHILSILKSQIGREMIVANRSYISFAGADSAEVDVLRFYQSVASLDLDRDSASPAALDIDTKSLHKAEQLYRGRFMSGFYLDDCFAFEEWQESVSRDLEQKYHRLLNLLIRVHSCGGDYEAATEFALRRLAFEPESEVVLRQVMELCRKAGKSHRAIAYYEEFKRKLESDYGGNPQIETEELSRRIKSDTIRSKRYPVNTLPAVNTSFIGRGEALDSVCRELCNPNLSIVTVSGPAGMGKTRLALEAASSVEEQFPDGSVFVDASIARSPQDFIDVLAQSLQVQQMPGDIRNPRELIRQQLSDRGMLIILDNLEHLMPQIAVEVAQLSHCNGPTFLVTTREILRVRGEKIVDLDPLELPFSRSPVDGDECESVRLFIERSGTALANFVGRPEIRKSIARICMSLDGLPLAIELAAHHAKVLLPDRVEQWLQQPLDVLNLGFRDAPDRQSSMRKALDWSYELLGTNEKRLFTRLSVFSGGFSLEAAAAILPEHDRKEEAFARFSSLVDCSLIVASPGSSRFNMLQIVREYALEKLREREDYRNGIELFSAFIINAAEGWEQELYSQSQLKAMAKLDEEYANISAVLSFLKMEQRSSDGLRLCAALGYYWFRRGRFAEGCRWLNHFAACPVSPQDEAYTALANYHLGWLTRMVSEQPFSAYQVDRKTAAAFEKSQTSARKAGTIRVEALATSCLGWSRAFKSPASRFEDLTQGVKLARKAGDPWALAMCLKIANSYLRRPDLPHANKENALLEAVRLAETVGDPFLLCQVTHGLGDVLLYEDYHTAAEPWYLRSLEIAAKIDDAWSIMGGHFHLATGYRVRDMFCEAKKSLAIGLECAAESGSKSYIGMYLRESGSIAITENQVEAGLTIAGASSNGDVARLSSKIGDLLENNANRAFWQQGLAMSNEEAVAYALAYLREPATK